MHHPGIHLAKAIKKAGTTQANVAYSIAVTRLTINQICNGKRAITANMALRFEAACLGRAELWMKRQTDYDLHNARIFEKKIARIRF